MEFINIYHPKLLQIIVFRENVTDDPLDFWVQTLAGHDVVGEQARRSCGAGGIPQHQLLELLVFVVRKKLQQSDIKYKGGFWEFWHVEPQMSMTWFSLYINLNLAKKMFL